MNSEQVPEALEFRHPDEAPELPIEPAVIFDKDNPDTRTALNVVKDLFA